MLSAIGITNQRETTVVWDRATGQAIHRAIVWQDRRTADICTALARGKARGPWIAERTGLLLDPYFSATKIAWILDHVPGARGAAEAGKLAFGTVDSWLLWQLTGGRVRDRRHQRLAHAAVQHPHRRVGRRVAAFCSRCRRRCCPRCATAADFGASEPALFGAPIAIRGIAGDQQAATIGQACFAPGMMKSTYGTGCFALLNTGDAMQIETPACSPRWPIACGARPPTRSRARSSSPAPPCSGCATPSI